MWFQWSYIEEELCLSFDMLLTQSISFSLSSLLVSIVPDYTHVQTETDSQRQSYSRRRQIAHVFPALQGSEWNHFALSFLFPTERSFCKAPGSAAQLPANRPLHVQSESQPSAILHHIHIYSFSLSQSHVSVYPFIQKKRTWWVGRNLNTSHNLLPFPNWKRLSYFTTCCWHLACCISSSMLSLLNYIDVVYFSISSVYSAVTAGFSVVFGWCASIFWLSLWLVIIYIEIN